MKLDKIEHNHKLTNILKVGLFAILMCMPFIASLSKMAYVACNKNAFESYYGETINQVELSKPNKLINGDLYHFEIYRYEQLFDTTSTQTFIYCNGLMNYQSSLVDTFDYESIRLIKTLNNGTSNNYISLINGNGTIVKNIPLNYYSLEFDFYATRDIDITNQQEEFLFIESFNKYSYLDNAFYYANNQVWEEDIFSWVKSGLFANSLGAFISVFGIAQNSYFNNLLTYWLVLIIIYIIIDLILGLFTLITHIISNRKVKE